MSGTLSGLYLFTDTDAFDSACCKNWLDKRSPFITWVDESLATRRSDQPKA